MVIHNQTVCFCAVTEFAVMVSSSSTAILDPQNVIVVVHHLMQQCGADLFDGASQGTGANVDLMECSSL